MSEIFEAVSKSSFLDLKEISDEVVGGSQKLSDPNNLEGSPVHANDSNLHPGQPPQDVKHATSLRVSALAPVFPFFDESHSAVAEQYRIIRTKILHSTKRPHLIVVSSPSSGDGKTITSINIAASLSLKDNMSILLVDADLRRPSVADLLGIPNIPGIAEVLSGRVSLSSAIIHAHEFPNLFILSAGEGGQSAAELLHSERWPGIIAQLRTQFNVVIMDAPPFAVVADYELLQHVSDGVIIVVRPDHSDRKACLSALQSVPKEKFIGIVLNCVKDWWLYKTYNYDYYRKKSRYTAAHK